MTPKPRPSRRPRNIVLVLFAKSVRVCTLGVLTNARGLVHQLGDGRQFAEQVSGPRQLLQIPRFGCMSREFCRGERFARWNAMSPVARSKALGIMRGHQQASCYNGAVFSRDFSSRSFYQSKPTPAE